MSNKQDYTAISVSSVTQASTRLQLITSIHSPFIWKVQLVVVGLIENGGSNSNYS